MKPLISFSPEEDGRIGDDNFLDEFAVESL